jgi:hypothetical protein
MISSAQAMNMKTGKVRDQCLRRFRQSLRIDIDGEVVATQLTILVFRE